MSKVFVVTGYELGWDNVVAVFRANKVTQEQLDKVFPSSQYYISERTIENDVKMWEDGNLDDE